jgi:hypothetical protein
MGWSGSSQIAAELITVIFRVVPSDTARMNIYQAMITALEDQDGDTLDECLGLDSVYDKALEMAGYDLDNYPGGGGYGGPLVREPSDANTLTARIEALETAIEVIQDLLNPNTYD